MRNLGKEFSAKLAVMNKAKSIPKKRFLIIELGGVCEKMEDQLIIYNLSEKLF